MEGSVFVSVRFDGPLSPVFRHFEADDAVVLDGEMLRVRFGLFCDCRRPLRRPFVVLERLSDMLYCCRVHINVALAMLSVDATWGFILATRSAVSSELVVSALLGLLNPNTSSSQPCPACMPSTMGCDLCGMSERYA